MVAHPTSNHRIELIVRVLDAHPGMLGTTTMHAWYHPRRALLLLGRFEDSNRWPVGTVVLRPDRHGELEALAHFLCTCGGRWRSKHNQGKHRQGPQ